MKQKLKEGNIVTLVNPTSEKQFKVRILRLLDYNTKAVIQFHNGEHIIVSTTWLKKSKIMEYNIGDKVIDVKTNRIAYIAQKYKSKQKFSKYKYYYFIVFINNTGCYRNQIFLKLF